MPKFHINAKGVPAPCKATKGNCPFGDADSHFENRIEAQEYADTFNEEIHNYLPEVEVKRVKQKEVQIKGSYLYVDGKYITDLAICDYDEREQIVLDYGIHDYMSEILDL